MIILPYTCVKSVHKIATPDVGGQKSWTSAGTGCCPLFFSSLPKLLALLTFESMVVSLSFFFLAARAALYLHMNDCLTDRLVVLPGPPHQRKFYKRVPRDLGMLPHVAGYVYPLHSLLSSSEFLLNSLKKSVWLIMLTPQVCETRL